MKSGFNFQNDIFSWWVMDFSNSETFNGSSMQLKFYWLKPVFLGNWQKCKIMGLFVTLGYFHQLRNNMVRTSIFYCKLGEVLVYLSMVLFSLYLVFR